MRERIERQQVGDMIRQLFGGELLPKGTVHVGDPLDEPICPDYPELDEASVREHADFALEAARIVTNSPEWRQEKS